MRKAGARGAEAIGESRTWPPLSMTPLGWMEAGTPGAVAGSSPAHGPLGLGNLLCSLIVLECSNKAVIRPRMEVFLS